MMKDFFKRFRIMGNSTSNMNSLNNRPYYPNKLNQVIEASSFVFDPRSKTVAFSILEAKAFKRIFFKVDNVDSASLELYPEERKLFVKEIKDTGKLLEIHCANGKLKIEGENIRYAICVEPADVKSVFDSPF